jgi:hypothetical protein
MSNEQREERGLETWLRDLMRHGPVFLTLEDLERVFDRGEEDDDEQD